MKLAFHLKCTAFQYKAAPTDAGGEVRVNSVQSLSHVRLFATPWTAAFQVSLSITNSQSLLKLMSIESVMPSNHLILCHPLLLLPSIFPSIRIFSSESVFHSRWPKYWSFSFSLSQGGRDQIQRSAWCALGVLSSSSSQSTGELLPGYRWQCARCQVKRVQVLKNVECFWILFYRATLRQGFQAQAILFKICYFDSK